jgi:hypothetical protein
MLAGIPVADRLVLDLARRLRNAELIDTAETLEDAYAERRVVALAITDREAIVPVLEPARPGVDPVGSIRCTTVAIGTAGSHSSTCASSTPLAESPG